MLEMQGISKAFPGVQALDNTSLTVSAGTIHGLVGENGAGKSTIIKVLAGVYSRDAGTILVDGQHIDKLTPKAAHAAGVRFIHQELHLVPHFTVAESVFMGQELTGPFGIRRRDMRKRAEAFLKQALNAPIRGRTLIRDLGPAERKLVQIARALVDERAKLVIFDEPTAPLASGETEQVFRAIERLKERGITMIYVSHYLNEITELCDSVTVFRNGKDVAELHHVSDEATDNIIHHMVGRDIDALYPDKAREPSDTVFAINELGGGSRFRQVTLGVKRGEILGLAGLIGSGREELVDTLYGLRKPDTGSITFDGKPLVMSAPATAVSRGIVLVPRDRRHDGLVLDMSVSDNVNLASLSEVSAVGLEQRSRSRARAKTLSESLDVRPRNVNAIVRFLSGGNQQKVVLARWLATGAKFFILDEPTVGVDIGAKVEIYQLIENLAREGAAVLVSSSDPAELLGLCDRIAVMHRGELIADTPTVELSMDRLLSQTTAGQRSVQAS